MKINIIDADDNVVRLDIRDNAYKQVAIGTITVSGVPLDKGDTIRCVPSAITIMLKADDQRFSHKT